MNKGRIFKNILIFGHSNIGDVCYDLVVVRPLREAFPESRITFVTSPKAANLVAKLKGIDEILIFDKHGKDQGPAGYARFIREINRRGFDGALILRDMQMHLFFNSSEKWKLNRAQSKNAALHPVEKYLSLLERLGITPAAPRFEFQFTQAELDFVSRLFEQYNAVRKKLKVGIMPLAGWPLKCWPVKYWNEVINFLTDKLDAAVFVLGRKQGGPWDEEVVRQISRKAISIIDKAGLGEDMALMSGLNLFIGPDTSVLHIAGCMGVAAIGLYGATDKDFVYPFFYRQNMVISLSTLDCMPCYPGRKPGVCGVNNKPAACMEALSAEMVIERIKQVIR